MQFHHAPNVVLEDGGGWCALENDPSVFRSLLKDMGVENVNIQEITSLQECQRNSKGVYGLIYLFKYDGLVEVNMTETSHGTGIWFANQASTF